MERKRTDCAATVHGWINPGFKKTVFLGVLLGAFFIYYYSLILGIFNIIRR